MERSLAAFAATLALVCAVGVGSARAEEGAAHETHEPHAAAPPSAPLDLPPAIRAALIEEMQAVLRETQAITSAIPLAEWGAVEQAAARIRASYILERKLGPEDKAALGKALPEGFVLLDQRFHDDAERLSEAAQGGQAETVVFYTSRLLDGCVSCHARYASTRFPGFAARSGAPHGH